MYSVYHININKDLKTGYIGISKNPEIRFEQHHWQRSKTNQHLQNAFKKYKDLIVCDILISNIDKEFACFIEEELRPTPNIGWNIAKGGGIPPSPKGKIRSKEYCDNISKAKLGDKNPMYGKNITFSEEHRKNISIALKGKPNLNLLGRKRPVVTCPHCNKQGGAGSMHLWHFDRCKKNESK